MRPVYLVVAKRTPIGRFGGALKAFSAANLVTELGRAILTEKMLSHLEQIILGQVIQAGTGMNVARQLGLSLGVSQVVPAYTINMACGSSLKAVALGAASISTGESDVVLAGGVESMSNAPYYANDVRWGRKLGDSPLVDSLLVDGLSDPFLKIGMGETAERIVDELQISREEQDAYSVLSQRRVAESRADFARELVPSGSLNDDEHPRADTTAASLAKLKPAFRPTGTVTAGNSSGINDGAALVLLASEAGLNRMDAVPLARIVASAAVGCDPALMGLGPVAAITKVCKQAGWQQDRVDTFEINEAFAAQTLGCARKLGIDVSKLNQRGGAIALGHPIGASGARILVTLLHLMIDRKYRRGIASLCVGGGMGVAVAIERD